jgi:hypothetical protein
MRGRLIHVLAALVFSGALAGAAAAQDRPGMAEEGQEDLGWTEDMLFQVIDMDGDGYITREELLAWFEAHDRAGDGRLDESEFAAFLRLEGVDPSLPEGQPGAGTELQPEQAPDATR